LAHLLSGMGLPPRNKSPVDTVDRPQDIEDEDAMRFFGGEEGDADLSQG
jgi:hypothetical protein